MILPLYKWSPQLSQREAKGGGVGIAKLLVAIVFGHEIHIFIPKFGQNSHFYSLKCLGGGPPA